MKLKFARIYLLCVCCSKKVLTFFLQFHKPEMLHQMHFATFTVLTMILSKMGQKNEGRKNYDVVFNIRGSTLLDL